MGVFNCQQTNRHKLKQTCQHDEESRLKCTTNVSASNRRESTSNIGVHIPACVCYVTCPVTWRHSQVSATPYHAESDVIRIFRMSVTRPERGYMVRDDVSVRRMANQAPQRAQQQITCQVIPDGMNLLGDG